MTASALYPAPITGEGLVLRPWDEALVDQLATWGERGFPYHAFDLGFLRDHGRAESMLSWAREESPHRHFIACEGETAVGRVSVNLRDESGLYLWAVHVPPEQEGRGVCRRMLAALMTYLESEYHPREFVLTTNTFAFHAHRAYEALGFATVESRWHFDREIAAELWRVSSAEREPISRHIRFQSGRWEVRTFVMKRPAGAPMQTGVRDPVSAQQALHPQA